MAVYFIQCGGPDGFIKIGVAVDVRKRLSSLQSGSPLKLTLLHDIPGDPRTEAEMQMRFLHLHHQGEWFQPGEDLLEFCRVKRRRGRPGSALLQRSPLDEIAKEIERGILLDPVDYLRGLDKIAATWQQNREHSRYVRSISEKHQIPIAPVLLAYIEKFEAGTKA